jgi:D-alanine-D-alanine ligase
VWVKPARLGSSVGISKVTSPERGLDEAVELAGAHDPRVIIEADGAGREVECSVLGNDDPRISMPGEIVAHADWYDYEAKYEEGGMELIVPARIPDAEIARVRELAAQVFRAIAGSGLARCDFFFREDGTVLVNELNTIPGFTATSVFAKLFDAEGIPYPELCDRLVQLGLERHEAQREYQF